MRLALTHDGFHLHYQPQVDLRTGRIFAEQLIGEARQTLRHLVGKLETRGFTAVALTHLGFLGNLANQARDEARLVDQAEVRKKLYF